MALCTITGKIKNILPVKREICLLITLVSVLLILSLSLVIVIPQFTQEFQQLIIQLPSSAKALWGIITVAIEKITKIFYGENASLLSSEGLVFKDLAPLPDGVALANGITDSLKRLLDIAGDLGAGIVQTIFVLSIGLMIAVQPDSYKEIIIQLTPSLYRKRARKILAKCGNALSNWMVGVIISSSFVALLAGLSLYLLGIKLVVANALIAGALNIIPNIGPTISTIFPISVALLDAPWKSIAILVSYITIQNLESYLITPSVMHSRVKLLPALTLTAQFIFTVIFGPLGLLLSLPLAVVIQVLIKEIIINDILDKRLKSKPARSY
ncbi:hypothetical protein EV11_1664 [Prochlorococcus sp. SS52]|uniref:Uncharacterized conserved membrane protein n=2 Tax=Prochlorococcaceae TaxID=2881426 RepID=Q7VCH0_PROMA|nr:Uncharacterized conserved membrane protein [Prochlorococcus marinus subsp. marinus str. CCMP1375]KGG11840.1 hypothetical protein EV04_0865 [Prochlorococcus marinus str. LG]KGG23716.1 hypothetical protein EV09_1341 [Prochlorococcus marinus str. SS35]KGG32048.1 hypothetical protein EV10_1162 [Prochlorococcus marinus str. SS51]KGG35261.1 hypothetical protein EV11_1664 [Prochlorococcus sp. SS52]